MEVLSRYGRYLVPILLIVCFCLFYYCWFYKSPLTTVILVRHADRSGSVDQLNALGLVRAQELARVLDEAEIQAIYASNFNRTQQTADPLATALGLSLNLYDAGNIPALVSDIRANHSGKTVLVVGHSNTVPETIGLLGISPAPPEIPHNTYDRLYILNHNFKSHVKLLLIEYGANTP